MRFLHLAVTSAFLLAGACGDDNKNEPEPQPGTISAIVAADARFSTLGTALSAAELTETLGGTGPFTVFAPTNDAFAALPAGALDALLADKEALTNVLTYHVVSGRVAAADVVNLTEATALNGDKISIAVVDGKVVLNGNATVTITDIAASNGIVHVIDAVLLPPEAPVANKIPDALAADGRFTTLLAAVTAANLGSNLSGDGKLTVFAPTDAAFAALPEGTVEALLADIPKLTDILTYHVVNAEVRAETVVTLKRGTALNGVDFAITVDESGVTINGTVKVTQTDILADNGVIHVLDAVMLPPGNIVEIAAGDDRFETLVAAVTAANLVDTLSGAGPFTVFAPTDDAFAALPEGTVAALLADIPALTEILQYHVASGKNYSDAVVTLTEVETLLGETVTVTVEDGKVFLNDSEVIIADIIARNGVIHVIDAVLLPPAEPVANKIPDALAADGRFTTLLAAVTAANLGANLSGDDKLTVFAPTDAAFAALPEGTVTALLADIPKLTDILTYHVVNAEVREATVVTLKRGTALNGVDFAIAVDESGVTINGTVKVTQTDILTDNGVIHVIDAVMLPPGNIVEIAVADGRFETLVAAVTAANLVDTLSGTGPFTVFAPTDAAFAALPEGTVESLLANIPALTEILQYHVFSGKAYSDAVVTLTEVETLLGETVAVTIEDGKVFLNDSEVIITDIIARNGIIHVIDAVLLPAND